MRILFATTSGTGHFRPLLPFAHAYREAGHDVVVAGPAPVAPLTAREGLAFRPVGEASAERLTLVRRGLDGLRGEERVLAATRDLFIGSHGRAALPAMLDLVERFRPDVILRETAEASSLLAAEVYGVPDVRVGLALSTPNEDYWIGLAAQAIDELRLDLGLEPDPGAERVRRSPVFTQSPPALDDPGREKPLLLRRYRGGAAEPARPLPDWWDGSIAPLVPVSFGTVVPKDGHFPGLYRAAIDAVSDLPVRVLVTVGEHADPARLGALPSSVRVERWVPQAAVMPHAAAMVSHGGAGTTLAALAAGVPMAVLPLFADQPLNARRVAELGAGVALADIGELRDAVIALLDDPRYGSAAAAIAEEIQELPLVAESLGDLPAAVR
jgi:UDP:flavonoid glycosyltransferase YjiC (YdhE family)